MSAKIKSAPSPPKTSPWGEVQWSKTVTPGIYIVTTPGHGGVKLSAEWNRKIPKAFRLKGGWYEQDVDAAIPLHFLPEQFKDQHHGETRKTLREWRWREWEEHYKEDIPFKESKQKSRHFWLKARKDKWIMVAAWSDSEPGVPPGKVGVAATRGGDQTCRPGPDGTILSPETTYWLVDENEYQTRFDNPARAIVVDPGRHEAWNGPSKTRTPPHRGIPWTHRNYPATSDDSG